MIVKNHQADGFVRKPPRGLIAALVYGPDAGLVRERGDILLKTAVADLSDPFRFTDLDEETIVRDPARLADEAQALSMLGGRRAVRVRDASNALTPTAGALLADPKGDTLIVFEAGDLAKSAALRSVFEKADNAAAIACYPDSDKTLPDLVRDALRADGLAIAPDALEEAVSKLGADRAASRREIEKLALYAMGKKQVTLQDVREAMGDESELRIDEALDAAGEGDVKRLDLILSRLAEADTAPVTILRRAISHLQQLLLTKGEIAAGVPAAEVMKKRRLHFSREDSFRLQLRKWNGERLMATLDALAEAEILCKTTDMPARAICERAFFDVAVMAVQKTGLDETC
jgi:DNA polymerase III subunit delta